MIDIRAIRDDPEEFDEGRSARGIGPSSAGLIELDDLRRKVVRDLQESREEQNHLTKMIQSAFASGDRELAAQLKGRASELKALLPELQAAEKSAVSALERALLEEPNTPGPRTPLGRDESHNQVLRVVGTQPPFEHWRKQHFQLGEDLGLMDFESATRISGSRFVFLRGALARMERALAQFMLDLHVEEHGYTEVSPPLLVRDAAMYGTAQLPKFREDQFRAGDDHWLIPTAEVSLTNMVRETILDNHELPLRLVACTPCFRAEAGSAGRDTRGMIRQHQFLKVEMVSITAPDGSDAEHERMVRCAETVLQRLGLHYRVLDLCTGDLGFASRRTYDLEVWLPGQHQFREISSCSTCGDFQARRMSARYKSGSKTGFVHTLNGSGVAVGRALVAVMENYQNPDGSITVPEVLRPYMGGLEIIR